MKQQFALVVLLSALCACSTSAPVAATYLDPRADIEKQTQVVFADSDLVGEIEIGTPTTERTPDTNLLAVSVPIRNRTSYEVQLLVQVEFLDQGHAYEDATPKRVMIVPRGGTRYYVANSQKARAQDFLVRIWRNRGEW